MASSIRSISSRLALALLLFVAGAAVAQPKKNADEQAARALFADGQKAYDLGEFDRALTLYSDAYKLKSLPGFLFNIGQCHKQLGNFERAAFFFGRFIDNSKPEAANVALAKELKADMEKRQAEKVEAERKAADEKAAADKAKASDAPIAPPLTPAELSTLPPPPPPAVEPEPVTKKAWFWVVIGGAVVATAAGVTAGVVLSQPQTVMYVPRPTSLPDIDGRR